MQHSRIWFRYIFWLFPIYYFLFPFSRLRSARCVFVMYLPAVLPLADRFHFTNILDSKDTPMPYTQSQPYNVHDFVKSRTNRSSTVHLGSVSFVAVGLGWKVLWKNGNSWQQKYQQQQEQQQQQRKMHVRTMTTAMTATSSAVARIGTTTNDAAFVARKNIQWHLELCGIFCGFNCTLHIRTWLFVI